MFVSLFLRQRDVPRIVFSQRQFIAAHADLDRVAHWGDFDHGHFRLGDQPHIEQPEPERAFAADCANHTSRSNFKLVQRHVSFAPFSTCVCRFSYKKTNPDAMFPVGRRRLAFSN
jgi:hypothetical protein